MSGCGIIQKRANYISMNIVIYWHNPWQYSQGCSHFARLHCNTANNPMSIIPDYVSGLESKSAEVIQTITWDSLASSVVTEVFPL